jgi:hypothetical protein
MTEVEWHAMMHIVVPECRRVLKPTGSAVFVLQPNYERIGKTRLWLWDFVAWAGREWGLIQDVYWWNYSALPSAGCERKNGLLRRSMKHCVWVGPEDCYRDQDGVLWSPANHQKAIDDGKRYAFRQNSVSGGGMNKATASAAMTARGGVTPFDVLLSPSSDRWTGGGVHGHGASTPFDVCDWWTRYISPEGGTILDPFMGSGTVGLAALARGRDFIGVERDEGYFKTAERRIQTALAATPLLS